MAAPIYDAQQLLADEHLRVREPTCRSTIQTWAP